MLLPMRQIFQEMAAEKLRFGIDHSCRCMGDPMYRSHASGGRGHSSRRIKNRARW